MPLKAQLEIFKQNIENLLSKERLFTYTDLQAHTKNLNLIAKITPKIALIEISLRNMLDFCMTHSQGEAWLISSKIPEVEKSKGKISTKYQKPSHPQLLSNLSLGTIAALIKAHNLQTALICPNNLNLRSFSSRNKDNLLSDCDKSQITLNLLVTLRNRCFHWENILKTERDKKGKLLPSLTTKLPQGRIFSIWRDNIELFLDCIIDSINPQLHSLISPT